MSYGIGKYGLYAYSEDTDLQDDFEIDAPDLIRYLPKHYRKNLHILEIQESLSNELSAVTINTIELEKQFLISTASWALSIYEKELGLITNYSLSTADRVQIIMAKLRGIGTTTTTMIKNTAIAFSGGDVDIIEYPEESRFVVQFIGIKGIPPNMQAFIDMLESIKPAHLSYEFKYTFTVWNNLSSLMWSQANSMSWDALRIHEGE